MYFNKTNGPLATDVRLGSQISVVNLTDQDLAEFVNSAKEGTNRDVFENQTVNPVTIMRSYLHSTLNPLIGTFKRDGGGTFSFPFDTLTDRDRDPEARRGPGHGAGSLRAELGHPRSSLQFPFLPHRSRR